MEIRTIPERLLREVSKGNLKGQNFVRVAIEEAGYISGDILRKAGYISGDILRKAGYISGDILRKAGLISGDFLRRALGG